MRVPLKGQSRYHTLWLGWYPRVHRRSENNTAIPLVLPTNTAISLVLPTNTAIPLVLPTNTAIPLVLPTNTAIPLVLPTNTAIPAIGSPPKYCNPIGSPHKYCNPIGSPHYNLFSPTPKHCNPIGTQEPNLSSHCLSSLTKWRIRNFWLMQAWTSLTHACCGFNPPPVLRCYWSIQA